MKPVVLVADGGSHLGAEVSRLFGESGAAVEVVEAHVNSAEADRAVAHVVNRFGRIDVVVTLDSALLVEGPGAAAGVRSPEPTDAQWSAQLSRSLDSAYFLVRAALREMIPQGSGSVVVITAMAGVCGESAAVERSAAAAALLGMTRSLARETAATGVRINAVAASGLQASDDGPANRPVTPEEIAAVVLFLAGPDASYISGETVNVNGARLTI